MNLKSTSNLKFFDSEPPGIKKFFNSSGLLRLALVILLVLSGGLLVGCSSSLDDMDGMDADQKALNKPWSGPGAPELFTSTGTIGTAGSCIGPGGMLYVTEGAAGKISRIDPKTGDQDTFVEGLPVIEGGVFDVAFIGGTGYALVTLVSDPNLFPTAFINGIYRIDGPNSFEVIADLGQFNMDNPPPKGQLFGDGTTGKFPYFVQTGVMYAMHKYRNGFLVTDGHLNRVLYVTKDGQISIFKEFENVVPTGLEVSGNTIYMAQAGNLPHEAQDGSKLVSFGSKSSLISDVGSGTPLLVDVEFNKGRSLFALAQGTWGNNGQTTPGDPADPDTGSLSIVNDDGTFTEVASGLNLPTSMEFIGNKAYIFCLTGEIWTVDMVSGPPFGA